LSYGDISTCSFHATKIFHTGEGGAIICKDEDIARELYFMRQFGHFGDDYYNVGINGKSSEIHAAIGLCIFDDFEEITEKRKTAAQHYDDHLDFAKLKKPQALQGTEYNYSYYPILFDNEKALLKVIEELNKENIFPRRYFYPSLNNLPFLKNKVECLISEDISSRIICLPFSSYITLNEIKMISSIINNNI
jgi:dTDP-4-amino-4,6-dideoxygalactose transaminase